MRIYYLIAFFILIIDQATKFWILYVLQLEKLRSFDVFSPYLTFQFAWNKGINFGLFSSNEAFVKWVLLFITLFICFFITLYTFKVLTTNFERTMAGFVLGGAAGNVFDRAALQLILQSFRKRKPQILAPKICTNNAAVDYMCPQSAADSLNFR